MDESKLKSIPEPERASFRQLMNRCEKAGIEYKLEPDFPFLEIYLPCGRERRGVTLFDAENANKFAQVEFEKYVFIQGYQGICCYQDGYVEAFIRLLRPRAIRRASSLLGRLLGIPYSELKKMKEDDLVFKVENQFGDKGLVTITISRPTDTILSLTQRELDEGSGITVKIGGLKISTNEQAVAVLEKLANSLFFQIESIKKLSMMLETYYERPPIFWSTKAVKRTGETPIAFPKYEYNIDPLNLYWYAKSASGMPLLQFLAYYQVLEFYFPTYSRRETSTVVTNILKDTNFDPNRDLDVNKVISAVLTRMGRGYADEKQQLRATIQACVQGEEIRAFMEEYDYIINYFKSDFKKLSPVKVSIDNRDLDLRDQIAERLYDIRCKIVHTKSGETEAERIIPFTEEESLLPIEIDIIEFIARKILVAGSRKLSI